MTDTPNKNNRQGAVQGIKDIYAGNSTYNQLHFIISRIIDNEVSTAVPVKVEAVHDKGATSPTGRVDVLPLVCSIDAEGNTIDPTILYNVPYSRVQGGVAAIVIDPVPGDIGLCVFCKSDTSNIKTGTSKPQQPGSFRNFDMADGFYVGCFLNQAPKVYIELAQDETVMIKAKNGVTIEAPDGGVKIKGSLTVEGTSRFTGNINVDGDVVASGKSLVSHTHGGVERGGADTYEPN